MEKTKGLASSLKDKLIEIRAKEKEGKLFGSISGKDIAQQLSQAGFNILEKSIILPTHIKEIGEYEIKLDLAQGIETKIKLRVSREV